MCFDPDAHPPIPAREDVPVEVRDVELVASDGNRFAAFEAFPAAGTDVGMVVLPDVRGLYGFYVEFATRLAENGVHAVVVDYYGRTAGAGRRPKEFPYQDHMNRLSPRQLYADLQAAVDHLADPDGAARRSVFTVGFCIGGRLAVLAGAGPSTLAGTVGFYCWPAPGPDGAPGPTARARELRAPVLALMAGDDPGIPQSAVEDFDAALTEAGLDHEVVVYPGTPHSFFDAAQDTYLTESLDAWSRLLGFVERVAATPVR